MDETKRRVAELRREIVFLSSSKAKRFAKLICSALNERIHRDENTKDEFECLLWDDRKIFKKSYTTFDSLLKYAEVLRENKGFAVCVLYPDDLFYKNGDKDEILCYAPRDNVVFELGLFYGALGKDNVLFLFCNDANSITVHKLSDLEGVAEYPYQWDNGINAPADGSEAKLAEDLFETIRANSVGNISTINFTCIENALTNSIHNVDGAHIAENSTTENTENHNKLDTSASTRQNDVTINDETINSPESAQGIHIFSNPNDSFFKEPLKKKNPFPKPLDFGLLPR